MPGAGPWSPPMASSAIFIRERCDHEGRCSRSKETESARFKYGGSLEQYELSDATDWSKRLIHPRQPDRRRRAIGFMQRSYTSST